MNEEPEIKKVKRQDATTTQYLSMIPRAILLQIIQHIPLDHVWRFLCLNSVTAALTKDYDWQMRYLRFRGSSEVHNVFVSNMIARNEPVYNYWSYFAFEQAEFLTQKQLNSIFGFACSNNVFTVVEALYKTDINDEQAIRNGFYIACENDHLRIFNLLTNDDNLHNYGDICFTACRNNSIVIMERLILDYRFSYDLYYEECHREASFCGSLAILQLLHRYENHFLKKKLVENLNRKPNWLEDFNDGLDDIQLSLSNMDNNLCNHLERIGDNLDNSK